MKKLTALILALIMLLSCAVTAMAEFDRSVLTDETAQSLIVLEFDETNTNAYIESRLERSALAFDHPNAHPDEPSLVEFDMIVLDYHTDDPYPALRLWVRYRGTEYLYIDGISFEVDGLTYRFDVVGDPSRIYDENGKYSENALVVFGLNQSLLISGLLGYMQQFDGIDQLEGASVKMILHGATDVEVTLNQAFLLDFLTVANFYATSGSMDYMVGIEGTAMTITE